MSTYDQSIYILSCVCFHCIYCFNHNYSLTRVFLFRSSTVLYHYQQCQHVLDQHLCRPNVLPSKCNQNTTSTTIRTQSDNGNGDRDMQTTTQQRNVCNYNHNNGNVSMETQYISSYYYTIIISNRLASGDNDDTIASIGRLLF